MSITREAARVRLCGTMMERFRLAAQLSALDVGWVPSVDKALAGKALPPARERSVPIESPGVGGDSSTWSLWPKEFWQGIESGDAASLEFIRGGVDALADHATAIAEAVIEPRRVNAILHRASLAWRFPVTSAALLSRPGLSLALPLSLVGALEREPALIPAAIGRKLPTVAGFGRAENIPAREATGEPAADGVRFTMWGGARTMPPGVTLEDVIAALRNASTQDARAAAQVIADADARMTDQSRESYTYHEAALSRALWARNLPTWHPWAVAAVLYTLRESDDAHRDSYVFSTAAPSFAATVQIAHMGRAQSVDNTALRTFFHTRWEGKIKPVQFSLPYDEDLDGAMLGSLLEETSEWGLRDWFGYHVLADRYGRTGEFPVDWETFKRIAGYDEAIDDGARFKTSTGRAVRMTDDIARRAWVARLWRFARAELWADVGGVRADKPVGNMPFLGIKAIGDRAMLDPWGKGRDIEFTHALVKLNPELYKGARLDSPRPHYTGLPISGFTLRGPAFRLHAFVAMRLRAARDTLGINFRITEAALMRYAGIDSDPKHPGRARSQLLAALDEMRGTMGDGASYTADDTSKERAFLFEDAQWRRELHAGAAPDRPAAWAFDDPQTCGALRGWREARELSQAQCAARLKVPVDAIKRAELRGKNDPSAALPRSLRSAPWRNGGAPRALAAGSPVEASSRKALPPGR